jgi:hypothetical protein
MIMLELTAFTSSTIMSLFEEPGSKDATLVGLKPPVYLHSPAEDRDAFCSYSRLAVVPTLHVRVDVAAAAITRVVVRWIVVWLIVLSVAGL